MKLYTLNSFKKVIVLILLSSLLYSCDAEPVDSQSTVKPNNEVHLSPEQYNNVKIELGMLENRPISESIKLNGKVDVPPQNLISISVAMGGYLRSSKLLPGMQVKKGEIIATLEDENYIQLQQDFLTAKADYVFLENEFKRQKELNEKKANSDKSYQQAKANHDSQYAILKSLEQNLKLIGIQPETLTADRISRFIQIVSPVNGFVSAVHVNIGRYINPNDVLFELIDPDDIHLILTVYEKDIHALEVGQTVVAYSNSNPTEKYLCEIILISRNIGNSEAAEVNCHFKSTRHNLLPGTFMNAEVQTQNNLVPSLPDDALVSFENKMYVFVAQGERIFKMVPVELGNSDKGFTEILNTDLFVKKKIVLKGAYILLMTLKNNGDE